MVSNGDFKKSPCSPWGLREDLKTVNPRSPNLHAIQPKGTPNAVFDKNQIKTRRSICWFLRQVEKIAFEVLLSRQGHLHDEWSQRLVNATARRAMTCRVRGYSWSLNKNALQENCPGVNSRSKNAFFEMLVIRATLMLRGPSPFQIYAPAPCLGAAWHSASSPPILLIQFTCKKIHKIPHCSPTTRSTSLFSRSFPALFIPFILSEPVLQFWRL